MKMTPWFPPEIRPVHVGAYQTRSLWSNIGALRWFDGELWSLEYFADEPKFVQLKQQHEISQYQEINWRGLDEEPK